MVSRSTFVAIAAALPPLAAAGQYLGASAVHELFAGKTYYVDVSQDIAYHKFKEFQFREDGTVDYRIYWTDGLWHTEIPWRVKDDGRVCFPNRHGTEKCRFVQVEGRKVLLFNKKGELKMTFTP